jgi:hypothetical protein
MLVAHIIEKRQEEKALARSPSAFEPMPIPRRSSFEVHVARDSGVSRQTRTAEWVDEKQNIRIEGGRSRESLVIAPPSYGQAMKEV